MGMCEQLLEVVSNQVINGHYVLPLICPKIFLKVFQTNIYYLMLKVIKRELFQGAHH